MNYFDGLIDEPFITAEAIDATLIKRMYNTGKANLEAQDSLSDGLVGYWKMDGDFTDMSGNGNTAIMNNGASSPYPNFEDNTIFSNGIHTNAIHNQ